MPNDNNLGNDDTNISAPRIRTFQMDSDSIGNVKKSVNLFRGDVNIPLNLISLPGRNGLDANVTAFYESNVQNSVSTWNLEAPTGILGMGWALPYDRVVFANPSNGSEYGKEYYLITGGSSELLVKVSPDEEEEEETDDGTGKHISTEYKTENYQFWKILHHRYLYNDKNKKDKDYWQMTKENGITYVYGGDFSVDEDGNRISAGNSIQWGVKWKNWFGSSSLDDGEQEQFALGWNIYQIRNCWDDIITFEYENTEQQVGRGLKYTKASYLEKITDSYGRTAVFYYGDKIYSEDKQEYQDPHKDLQPSGDCSEHVNLDTPNAYQDRYETKYLDVIRVNNEDNELLFSIHFDYGPDLKNIVDPSEPGLWKRYLLSITYQNVDSESLPGMKFEYYLDEADAHPGALKSITYPEGGKVEYTYKRSLLPNSRRDFEIQDMKNGEIPLSGKVPRVWFGEDYVVVALYDDSAGELHVSVYSWAGWWVEHYCGQSNCTKQGFASLQVTTEKDLFVIYYKGATEIISYRKNSYKYGSWDYYPAEITRQSTDSEDIRPILISGSNFVIVYDAGLSGNALQGYYWRNGEQAGWHSLSGFLPYADSSSQVALAGKNNYYIVYSTLAL